MSAEEPRYELVMPFVTVESQGGPHEDASYTAGWEMGALSRRMEHGPREEFSQPVRTESVSQADLIAMQHRYNMTSELFIEAEEWTTTVFTPYKEENSGT